jgi:hypothetical protein
MIIKVLFAILMVCLAVPLFADDIYKPAIFISSFENLGEGNDFIGDLVRNSLRVVVDITRQYNIVCSANISNYLIERKLTNISPSDLTLDFIKENYVLLDFDEVLYGYFTPLRRGREVDIEVNITRPLEDIQFFSKTYRGSTDIDIFDTIDEISLKLANALTGRSLGTAEILVSTTVEGSRIFMDGVEAGKNRVRFPRAIAGLPRIIEIKDDNDNVLFSKEVTAEEGKTYDLKYNFEEFLYEEKGVDPFVYFRIAELLIKMKKFNDLSVITPKLSLLDREGLYEIYQKKRAVGVINFLIPGLGDVILGNMLRPKIWKVN